VYKTRIWLEQLGGSACFLGRFKGSEESSSPRLFVSTPAVVSPEDRPERTDLSVTLKAEDEPTRSRLFSKAFICPITQVKKFLHP